MHPRTTWKKHTENWRRSITRTWIRAIRMPLKNSRRHPRRIRFFPIRRNVSSMTSSDMPLSSRAEPEASAVSISTPRIWEIFSATCSAICSAAGLLPGHRETARWEEPIFARPLRLLLKKPFSAARKRSNWISRTSARPAEAPGRKKAPSR